MTSRVRSRIQALDGEHNLRFEIQDTGVGMIPEQLEKIFTRGIAHGSLVSLCLPCGKQVTDWGAKAMTRLQPTPPLLVGRIIVSLSTFLVHLSLVAPEGFSLSAWLKVLAHQLKLPAQWRKR